MRAKTSLYRSERGAIFVQVSLVIVGLMVMNVFIVDYGILWTARTQAQAAADAGALAGATARAYDLRVIGATGVADVAQQVANLNKVWDGAGTPSVPLSPTCPTTAPNCVQVTVSRDAGGSPLPMIFGPMLEITSQGITATAKAIVGPANTTTCLKPWALPDEWREAASPGVQPTQDDEEWTFDAGDLYTPPSPTQATTATNYSTDDGDIYRFRFTDLPYTNSVALRRDFAIPLVLPGKSHVDSMTTCYGLPVTIGDYIRIDTALTPADATAAAWQNYAQDPPPATWTFDSGTGGFIENSCVPNCTPGNGVVSPRTWAVAIYDPEDLRVRRLTNNWSACPGGVGPCVHVVNIAGFFIDYLDPGAPPPNGQHGHWTRYPGTVTTGAGTYTIVENGSWLVQPRLIR